MSDQLTPSDGDPPAPVLTRTARPTGEAARCAVCGEVATPAVVGPARCVAHALQDANARSERSRQATWEANRRAERGAEPKTFAARWRKRVERQEGRGA